MVNENELDKILCSYIHMGGAVAKLDNGGYICIGYGMFATVALPVHNNDSYMRMYNVRGYRGLPKKYDSIVAALEY